VTVYGKAGRAWLDALPEMLERFRQQWDVVAIEPAFAYVGYAWVRPCVLGDGTKAVLKLAPPDKEFANEIAAMRLYAGSGAARLLAADETATALLLERLEPGPTLASLGDDVAATAIAARTAGRLFRPLPDGHSFPTVEQWGLAFKRIRERYNGGCGAFPADLFEPADELYDALSATQSERVLLHGDLHHFNILSAGDDWLAIDAKGLAGEREYEVGPFLYNETDGVDDLRGYTLRRISQFSAELGLDRRRLIGWGFACAVLSRLWNFEDTGEVFEDHLAVARALLPEL
jgi:streptomycin 6-kinase